MLPPVSFSQVLPQGPDHARGHPEAPLHHPTVPRPRPPDQAVHQAPADRASLWDCLHVAQEDKRRAVHRILLGEADQPGPHREGGREGALGGRVPPPQHRGTGRGTGRQEQHGHYSVAGEKGPSVRGRTKDQVRQENGVGRNLWRTRADSQTQLHERHANLESVRTPLTR